jgi:hypothetical protein
MFPHRHGAVNGTRVRRKSRLIRGLYQARSATHPGAADGLPA